MVVMVVVDNVVVSVVVVIDVDDISGVVATCDEFEV